MVNVNQGLIPAPSNERKVKKQYSWVGTRKMLIPEGWFGLVESCCAEIESALSPENPTDIINYFFATVREAKLHIYINEIEEVVDQVKLDVITSLLDEVTIKSTIACHICGCEVKENKDNQFRRNFKLADCGQHHTNKSSGNQDADTVESAVSLQTDDKNVQSDAQNTEESEQLINQKSDIAKVKLYNHSTLQSLMDNIQQKYRDRDEASQAYNLIKQLKRMGEYRALSPVSAHGAALFDELASKFPNFMEVITMLKGIHALSSKKEIPRVPAVLLLGPPGIGKTHFAESLAQRMNVGFKIIRMENQQSGSGLTGSAEHWGNSKTGSVFNLLTNSQFANPVIVVDELDKAIEDKRTNPISGLYSLLETNSANNFCDESMPELPINASHITWILTANDIENIPTPILSRVKVFNIKAPTDEQALQTAKRIYNNLRTKSASLSEKFDACLKIDVAKRLSTLSPRSMRVAIEIAFGKAAIADRNYLITSDIDITEKNDGMKIGFV